MTSYGTRRKYIDELGTDFGQMLHDVEEEWGYVLYRYQELMVLFGKDKRRVELLNALSPGFTHELQAEMSNALILGLCRLTDSNPRSVSVCHLPGFICDNPDLRKEDARHVSRAGKYARAARERRNKWLAHRDKERSDPTVTFGDIKAGLDAVHAAANAVTMGYWKHCIRNRSLAVKCQQRASWCVLNHSLKELCTLNHESTPGARVDH